MVLTELVGNAVEHGFPGEAAGVVEVNGSRDRGALLVTILDDGAGLPEKFSLDSSDRLGLQIVRTLVSAELDATMDLVRRTGEGERGNDGETTDPAASYAAGSGVELISRLVSNETVRPIRTSGRGRGRCGA